MLARAEFAFLVLTGEDEQADGSVNARLNVVHEAGLFQGKLGFRRAIVLLEEGCQEFSNIHGLGQIRFQRGNIAASFEEIRRVLEREELLPHALLGLADDNRDRVTEREPKKRTRREALYGD
jgi:predicted nucleotide-binding protein